MSEKLPRATHEGILTIGEKELSAAVLNDGRRVLIISTVFEAFDRPLRGSRAKGSDQNGTKLPGIIDAKNLNPFISNDLLEVIKPIEYTDLVGRVMQGYDATIIPLICEVYLEASRGKRPNGKDVLTGKQLPNAVASEILRKALIKVSIISLVDEATGYQYDRERKELQAILKAFISDEILKYQQQFQLSFYREIFRLWNIPFTPKYIKRKPQFIGHITNRYVYSNLPKGSFVLDKLKSLTPKTKSGNRAYQFHRHLTEEGKESLKKVLYSVEALASVSNDKRQFDRLIQEKYGQKKIPFTDIEEIVKVEESS